MERFLANLEQFRISLISCSEENPDNGIKDIIKNPAIKNIGKIYISISKKRSDYNNYKKLQDIKLLEKPVKLQVPNSEKREINVNIYNDRLKRKIIERTIIKY